MQAEHARNVARPVLYASVSRMSTVWGYLHARSIPRASVRLWSAHYGAGKHICGPATCKLIAEQMDATQWTDTAPGAGGSKVDETLLAPDFFTQPPPPPAPLDGTVVWYAAGGLHARGVISHDNGAGWK